MTMLKTLIVLCFCVFLNTLSFAQNKFKPGYYVTNRYDTVKGFLFLNNKISRPYIFNYKPVSSDSDFSEIRFSGLQSVLIGKDLYIPWYGKRGLGYIKKMDFVLVDIDKTVTETIPVKRIYKGKRFSLFHFYDVRDHYFLEEDGEMEALIISYRYLTSNERYQYLVKPPLYMTLATYQNQLIARMGQSLTKRQKNFIESCAYERSSLIKALKLMEHKKNE